MVVNGYVLAKQMKIERQRRKRLRIPLRILIRIGERILLFIGFRNRFFRLRANHCDCIYRKMRGLDRHHVCADNAGIHIRCLCHAVIHVYDNHFLVLFLCLIGKRNVGKGDLHGIIRLYLLAFHQKHYIKSDRVFYRLVFLQSAFDGRNHLRCADPFCGNLRSRFQYARCRRNSDDHTAAGGADGSRTFLLLFLCKKLDACPADLLLTDELIVHIKLSC